MPLLLKPRTSLFIKGSLISLLLLNFCGTLSAAPLPEAYGVWDRGETMDPQKYPFIRGTGFGANWDETEKASGVYDWSELDKAIKFATAHNESICLSFECGPKTPGWVYKAGVPKVTTNDTKHQDKFPYYPFYLSPIYKTLFQRYITAAATHIRSYPVEVAGL